MKKKAKKYTTKKRRAKKASVRKSAFNLEKALLDMGACDAGAKRFRGMSLEEAIRHADSNDIMWIADSLGGDEVSAALFKRFGFPYYALPHELLEALPNITKADIRQAVKAFQAWDRVWDESGSFNDADRAQQRLLPWVPNGRRSAQR